MDQTKKTPGRKPLPVPENLPAKSTRGKKIVTSKDTDLTPEQIQAQDLKRERHRIAYHVNKMKGKPKMTTVKYDRSGAFINPYIACSKCKGDSNFSIVHSKVFPGTDRENENDTLFYLYCMGCERHYGLYVGNNNHDSAGAMIGMVGESHYLYKEVREYEEKHWESIEKHFAENQDSSDDEEPDSP